MKNWWIQNQTKQEETKRILFGPQPGDRIYQNTYDIDAYCEESPTRMSDLNKRIIELETLLAGRDARIVELEADLADGRARAAKFKEVWDKYEPHMLRMMNAPRTTYRAPKKNWGDNLADGFGSLLDRIF